MRQISLLLLTLTLMLIAVTADSAGATPSVAWAPPAQVAGPRDVDGDPEI